MLLWQAPGFENQSLHDYRALYSSLEVPDPVSVNGPYRAEFIGPRFLVHAVPKFLPLGGLPGWYGKVFKQDNQAINLLRKRNDIVEAVPMVREVRASGFDDKPALVLTYDKRAPLMLRLLVDEFRSLDADTLLGLTIVDLPLMRKLVLPFLLRRD